MRIKRIEQGEPEVEITLAEALDEMTASYPPEQNARESIVSALNRGDEVVVNGVSYLGEDRDTDDDGSYGPDHSYSSFTIACVDCAHRFDPCEQLTLEGGTARICTLCGEASNA